MTIHGFKDASKDEQTILAWWRKYPFANIGIRTGPESGLLVFDFDGPKGLEALAQLQREHGPLPKVPTVRTGGSGVHLYFAYPADEVRSRSRVAGMALDIRAKDGYVIAPPSVHRSGNLYLWEVSPHEQ
jgi:hypothetical protein